MAAMFRVTSVFILLWINVVHSINWNFLPSCPENWDPKPCECLTYLTEVNVFCRKPDITLQHIKDAFNRLEQTTAFHGFYLFDTQINSLPSRLFGTKASFETFKFSGNPIHTVESGVFKGSENTAESIFFDGTRLTNLDFSSTHHLDNLYQFQISDDTGLKAIPDDAFGSNPKLAFIGLRGNKIESVGKRAFAKLSKLLSVDLAENKLSHLDEESISFNSGSGLTRPRIHLNNNELMSTNIHPNAFLNLTPEQLELDHNFLHRFDQEIFQRILEFQADVYPPDYAMMGKISVAGNPFGCDSSLLWLVEKPADFKQHVTGFECPNGTPLDKVTQETIEHFTAHKKI